MALTVALANSGTQNGTGTTIDVALNIAFAAGDILVAIVACDNGGSNGAISLSSTSTLSGETVTNRRNNNHDPGSTRAGDTLGIWTSVMATSKTGSETIRFTKASADYIGVVLWKVSSNGASGRAAYASVGGSSGADAATTSTTTGTLAVGYAVIGGTAYEGNTTITADTDSSNGSWSAQTVALANSGTTATSMAVASQYKVTTTAAATQTYNTAFTSSSCQAGYVTFREDFYPATTSISVTTNKVAYSYSSRLNTPAAPDVYWQLGETSGTTADAANGGATMDGTYSGSGITLNQTGAPTGDTNPSVSFTGGNVAIPVSAVTGSSKTFTLWFKTSSSGILMSKNSLATPTTNVSFNPFMYVGDDGLLRAEVFGATIAPITSANTVNDGLWHHVIFAVAATTQTLYLDGIKIATKTDTSVNDTWGPAYAYIGTGAASSVYWPGTTGTWMPFQGEIDEVAIYNSVLTDADVAYQDNVYRAANADTSGALSLPVAIVATTATAAATLSAGSKTPPNVVATTVRSPWVAATSDTWSYLRPNADDAAGSWTVSPLWSKVDEVVPDETDFITSEGVTTGTTSVAKLSLA